MRRKPLATTANLLAPLVLMGFLTTGHNASADPLAQADAQRAQAKLKKCARCHGTNGVSEDADIPHLAGQPASYLFNQIQHFAADKRDGGRMNKMVRKLDEQMRADLAKYYSMQSLPSQNGVTPYTPPALVSEGDAGRGLDACASCHGDDGRGSKDKYDAPALAGMPKVYFVSSMTGFTDGSRTTDKDQVMQKIAKALDASEFEKLASYYVALGQRQTP